MWSPKEGSGGFQRNPRTCRRNGKLTFALSFVCGQSRTRGQLAWLQVCLGGSDFKALGQGWALICNRKRTSVCSTGSSGSSLLQEIRGRRAAESFSDKRDQDPPLGPQEGQNPHPQAPGHLSPEAGVKLSGPAVLRVGDKAGLKGTGAPDPGGIGRVRCVQVRAQTMNSPAGHESKTQCELDKRETVPQCHAAGPHGKVQGEG